jgi:hypothetical protein
MNRSVLALFGVVTVLITATVPLTLSRATISGGSLVDLNATTNVELRKRAEGPNALACRRSICERALAVSHETRKRQY